MKRPDEAFERQAGPVTINPCVGDKDNDHDYQ
jgi:hypothetical protein